MFELLDIPNRDPVTIVGQVSSLITYKGQLVLLEAAKRVLVNFPNCIFLLVGFERRESGYKQLLFQRAAALGIADRVRIVGYAGPIGDVWNIIDIHVHASLLDSLPNALLEAMSLGKPSVVTAVGGIPDVIESGLNGLLVPPGNTEQLAQALLTVLSDTRLATSMGREARDSYCREFTVDIMTRRLEELFFNLAGEST